MKPYLVTNWVRVPWALLVLPIFTLLVSTLTTAESTPRPHAAVLLPSNDSVVKRGFDHFYNLDYDKSIRDFEAVVQAHPEDPYALNYLLSAVMFKELYRIGALDTEIYANDSFATKKARLPIDPSVAARIAELTTRALQMEEKWLQENPNDVDALYARGATRAMRATYVGMGEKAWMSALRSAVAARRDHERVLQLDPTHVDAKTVVGVHNYVMGSLSWPVKVAISVVGLGGSKTRGLQYLREAAAGGGVASMDARIALALFLRREQRYAEVLDVVSGMAKAYPRNFLFAMELANLNNAAGHGRLAIAQYREILVNCEEGKYSTCRAELADFGLGESLRGQRDFADAARAYEAASTVNGAEPELVRRATLAAGEMYDVLALRSDAMVRYQAVIAADGNSPQASIARTRMKQPFRVQ